MYESHANRIFLQSSSTYMTKSVCVRERVFSWSVRCTTKSESVRNIVYWLWPKNRTISRSRPSSVIDLSVHTFKRTLDRPPPPAHTNVHITYTHPHKRTHYTHTHAHAHTVHKRADKNRRRLVRRFATGIIRSRATASVRYYNRVVYTEFCQVRGRGECFFFFLPFRF